MKYLVIDIGGTFTKYAVMDEKAAFYEKGKIPTAKDSEEDFLHMIEELYERYRDDAEGIAISAPGFIDGERGFMRTAGSIFCVHDLDIVSVLESRLDIPVTVENDARCAAVAEMDRGSLKGCSDAVVIIIGTALGGTIFCGGRMLRGKNLFAGEFSYMLSDADDALNPKKVLAETDGAPALIRLAAKETGISEEELDGEKVFEMAQSGDVRILKALRRYTRRIAAHIMNCQFMVNPERIAVGGGISVQPLLIQYIREELAAICKCYPHEIPVPEVTVCQYYNDSNLIGALCVHLNRRKQ